MVLFERVNRKKPLLTKKNRAAQTSFAKLPLNEWRCLSTIECSVFGENQRHYISTTTPYPLSSTVVEGLRGRLIL